MTGYQIIKLWIKSWFSKPEIKKTVDFENPLKVNIYSRLHLDSPSVKGNHTVEKIRKYSRSVKNTTVESYVYHLTDLLTANPVRLFFNPAGNGKYDILLLTLEDEFPYSQDFHSLLSDPLFNIEGGGTFTRIGLLTTPRKAAVTEIQDVNGDGKIDSTEFSNESVKYWDYVKEEAATEFLFIELIKTSGNLQNSESDFFELWRGFSISSDNILVL